MVGHAPTGGPVRSLSQVSADRAWNIFRVHIGGHAAQKGASSRKWSSELRTIADAPLIESPGCRREKQTQNASTGESHEIEQALMTGEHVLKRVVRGDRV